MTTGQITTGYNGNGPQHAATDSGQNLQRKAIKPIISINFDYKIITSCKSNFVSLSRNRNRYWKGATISSIQDKT
jgi:hypothetical protein